MKLRFTMVVEEDLDYEMYKTDDPLKVLEGEHINCEEADSWLIEKFQHDNHIFFVDLRTDEGFLLNLTDEDFTNIFEYLTNLFSPVPDIIHRNTYILNILKKLQQIPGVMEDILHAINIETLKEEQGRKDGK